MTALEGAYEGTSPLQIRILHVPDCPLVARLRSDVDHALRRIGMQAVVEEIEGEYLSPTLIVNGEEVVDLSSGPGPACRLGLPTRARILAALRGATMAAGPVSPGCGTSEAGG